MLVNVLKSVDGYYSDRAVKLMEYTAVVESDRGHHLTQLGGGPGLGIMGVEPNTMDDIFFRYLARVSNFDRKECILRACCMHSPCKDALLYNMAFNILTARTKYWMVPHPLPNDIIGIAEYHEKFYNGGRRNHKGSGLTDQGLGILKYAASIHI